MNKSLKNFLAFNKKKEAKLIEPKPDLTMLKYKLKIKELKLENKELKDKIKSIDIGLDNRLNSTVVKKQKSVSTSFWVMSLKQLKEICEL